MKDMMNLRVKRQRFSCVLSFCKQIGASVLAFVLSTIFASNALAQTGSERLIDIIINGQTKTTFETPKSMATSGRVSGHFAFTKESLEKGVFFVKALNVVNYGVEQSLITGQKPQSNETSVMGFLADGRERQTLTYDKKTGFLTGEIKGQVSMDQFFELTGVKRRGNSHDQDMLTLPARMKVRINLKVALEAGLNGKKLQTVGQHKVEADFKIIAEPFEPLKLQKPLVLEMVAQPLIVEIDWLFVLEPARTLCIQPIRIGRVVVTYKDWPFGLQFPSISIQFSGDGLSFGSVGANTEWAKADVNFNVRDWLTIWINDYSTLTESEESSLRSEVSVDDCIEVFFVDRFSPQTRDGGGNTTSGGTSSSKVISSDENTDFGVDLTHLAHEYGHVLTLKHPGQGFPTAALPHRVDGSTNTLMCGSGFNNDNPKRNSEWNEDNIANPLLTFSFKLRTNGPDCTNDVDCGACP